MLDKRYEGSSYDASAGPAGNLASLRGPAGVNRQAGSPFGGTMVVSTSLSASERRVYDYVQSRRDGADYLMAVSFWSTAQPYILATGQEVLLIGGFRGQAPEPTLAQVQELVRAGRLRYFLFQYVGLGLIGPDSTAVTNWVERNCGKVPAADYGGTPSTGDLYRC